MAGSTPQYDSSKFYVPQDLSRGKVNDDERELELLHYIYDRPDLEEIRGSPQKVIDLIDEFGRTKHYLINVGLFKGPIVTDLIEQAKPETMLELGCYVGYSAILFGDAVRRAGGKKYYSLEKNVKYAAISTMLVELAGLRDFVEIIVGDSNESLHRLGTSGKVKRIDLMFLDHFKPAYLTDLKLCEHLGMITPGTILAGDNVIMPGNPPYLEYVRSTVEQKREKAKIPPMGYPLESFPDISLNMFNLGPGAKPAFCVAGNPNLVYDSKLIESIEPCGIPDGIEITRCVAIQE